MRESREGRGRRVQYLVLSRSCADLYDEIVELFADRTNIEVIVDRRRGSAGMTEIPSLGEPQVDRRRRRRLASMMLVLAESAEKAS
jgi:hypothetical protein